MFWEEENYIWSTNLDFDDSDKRIRMIQPSSDYGAVLVAWTLLHLKGKFGIKNTQKLEVYTEAMSVLKLWPSLLGMCQSSAVKDHPIIDKLGRVLCENLIIESIELDLFELVDYDPIVIKLVSYLLKRNARLSIETISNLESGIGLFVNKFIEMYPVDLYHLFELFTSIIKGAPHSLNKVWKLMNDIHTFNAVAPPDGQYIYQQETDTFSLTDQYYVKDSIWSIEFPKNTTFIINGENIRFNIKVPVFYFLNSTINNFRMYRDEDRKTTSYTNTKELLINSIKIIQSIANVATSLNNDIMKTCETLLTLVPSVSYIDSNYAADPEVVSEILKLARHILVYFPEQTLCYFNANNFFPFLMNSLEDSIVNLHPFSQNSIALMILKYGPEVYPVLTQYVKLIEASLKIRHTLVCQTATCGVMFVFKTIMPLLAVSDFFIGPKEKMDLGWACMRLIYVVSMLQPESVEDTLIMPIKKVLDLCLPHSPTSIASLMILNIATIGEKDFTKIMHNYHSWTTGFGKRNIQCLIFALSLLNYTIETKSLPDVNRSTNTAIFDPERRLAVLLSYRLTVFHNKLNTLSLTILGTLAEKRFVSFNLSMGFNNEERARTEMLSYLKLHRLHSTNIVKMLKFLHNAIAYQCKMFEIILNVELIENCIKENKQIESINDSILWFIEVELETDDFKQEQENSIYLETLGIIHTLWYNRFNLAMNYLQQNKNFWKLLFKPLFHNKMISEINSEVFSILSLQAHYCPIESNKEFSEQLNIFLKTRLNTILTGFLKFFEENNDDSIDIKRKLIYSWKFFTLLVLKHRNADVNDKHGVINNILKLFIIELKGNDTSSIVSLGESLLIMLKMWEKDCIMNSKSTIDNLQTILKLFNNNSALAESHLSKTTVLIVINEISSIIFSDDTFCTDNAHEDFISNEMYSVICELAEKQLENIYITDHEYRSILINLKLTNSVFYKIIPIINRLSTSWHQSSHLTNTIGQMLTYIDKCNKDHQISTITIEVSDFLVYMSSIKQFHSQFGTQPFIIKHLCTVLSVKCVTSTSNEYDIKYDDLKRLCVYKNYFKMLFNFLINCDSCVKKEAIHQLTSIFLDLSIILNFPNNKKVSSSHLNLVQSVIKLMNLIVSKEYYYYWQSIGGLCYIALEKIIISIWDCAYGSYRQLNDPDNLIISIFKNEKVQLNLPGWKTRGDIFTKKDLLTIKTTRKILFDILYSCNSILARIMIPPYEIVSLLQLGLSDASVFRNIISNEVIVDKKFSTFSTIDGLIEMIVFLSDKITRHGVVSTSLISALNERYALDVELSSLNDALELCVYTFTSQLLMKVSQNSDNNEHLNEIADVAKNMSFLLYRTISKDVEDKRITSFDIRSQQSNGDRSEDLLIGFMKLLEFIKDINRTSAALTKKDI
ncbi:Hypothetical protein CINCED_3A020988 [Cinara cedri]|nr:Hypothetical protein CINCED_3A020988 [Cinara cedri]